MSMYNLNDERAILVIYIFPPGKMGDTEKVQR